MGYVTILKSTCSWIEKKFSPTCISTSQINFIILRVPQSGMKTWCWLKFISRIISCVTNKLLSACVKTKLDSDKNNPKISGASVTNFHLTLAWAKDHFSRFKGLVRPIEPETSIFFQKLPTVPYNSSFNTYPAFFQQSNMALNYPLHKMWPQICILSSMKCWDLVMGR